MSIPSKIFLVGMPGSGKTTLGKQVAQAFHVLFFDLDEEIEKNCGQKIKDIFAKEGESRFRILERQTLAQLAHHPEPAVVATGGGVPCFYDNMALMNQKGMTLFLNPPIDTLIERLVREKEKRPLVQAMAHNLRREITALYEKRLPHYKEASHETDSRLSAVIALLKTFN